MQTKQHPSRTHTIPSRFSGAEEVAKAPHTDSLVKTNNDPACIAQPGPKAALGQPVHPAWKRGLDLGLILLFSPVIVPVFLIAAAWIKLTSRGPIFFQQERVGMSGESFQILKFRSMRPNAETTSHENYLKQLVDTNAPMTKMDVLGDRRLILGGGFLRASGLDELPQLINILRGEMSLVGPRPCTTKEYQFFKGQGRRRFDILPGLTGYWQVQGKNETTFTQMVEMDRYYVDHCRFSLDLTIIAQTPMVILKQVFQNLRKRLGKPGDAEPQATQPASQMD